MVENETRDFDQQQTGQEPDQMLKEENDAPSQLYQYFVHDNCLYLKDPVKGKEFPELKEDTMESNRNDRIPTFNELMDVYKKDPSFFDGFRIGYACGRNGVIDEYGNPCQYDIGYDEGWEDGYDEGYDDGVGSYEGIIRKRIRMRCRPLHPRYAYRRSIQLRHTSDCVKRNGDR